MIMSMVSPLLSVAVMGGQLAAARRLSKEKFGSSSASRGSDGEGRSKGRFEAQIFVRDVNRMALAGKVDVMCFDKTGTITKSGLDLVGVVPVWEEFEDDKEHPFIAYSEGDLRTFVIPDEMSVALAVTHTVSRLGERLIGHQVELRMVEAAQNLGWAYSSDMRTVSNWQIEHQWTFDHHTMTMSVLCTRPTAEEAFVFCKGSYEAVSQRCAHTSSTVLEGLAEFAEKLSTEGCYVLAIARKSVLFSEVADVTREQAEQDLTMVGLIVFRNEPKPDSAEAIGELRAGGVECVMVTGDSALTGAAIAKAVGICPDGYTILLGTVTDGEVLWRSVGAEADAGEESSHQPMDQSPFQGASSTADCLASDERDVCLAVTGDAFDILVKTDQIEELMACRGCGQETLITCRCARLRVYGRMAPHQKVQVVRKYAGLGHTVGMCGDGGNDSGALRAAHTGLALSGKAEASVAAPFSTGEESLHAMVLLLREGRASLCTSFAAYRFIVVRGIVWTQVSLKAWLVVASSSACR